MSDKNDDLLSFEMALRELKMRSEELERLISEGMIRAYRPTLDGRVQFRRTDVQALGTMREREPELFADLLGGDTGMVTEPVSAEDTLLAEATAALNSGDFASARDHFERAAGLLPASRSADAALALESATRMNLLLGEVPRAAALLVQAQALAPGSTRLLRLAAEVADGGGDVPTRERAWREVAAHGDPADLVGAYVALANIAQDEGQFGPKVGYLEQALAATPSSEAAQRAELWFELAVAHSANGAFDAAKASLVESEALATDAQPTLLPRLEGQRGVLALQRGDPVAALRHAEAARSMAVATNDVSTYLAASTTIVAIHEQAGRKVDVYDTLMRTQESLGDLLGELGKTLIAPAVAEFEQRLGPDEFQRTWDAWVATRRAARAGGNP